MVWEGAIPGAYKWIERARAEIACSYSVYGTHSPNPYSEKWDLYELSRWSTDGEIDHNTKKGDRWSKKWKADWDTFQLQTIHWIQKLFVQ